MKKNKIIEKDFFVLKINEPNKNFRKYPSDLIDIWIGNLEDNEYELEFAVDVNSKEIQYEYINSDLCCGIITKLFIRNDTLYAKAKFYTDGYKSEEIYEWKINLNDCVIIPKGKAEVRDGIVQKNYKLFGFNLINKSQSSFVY